MPEHKLLKDDVLDRMKRLDIRVDLEFEGHGRFQVVIVGGGALVLRDYITRGTEGLRRPRRSISFS